MRLFFVLALALAATPSDMLRVGKFPSRFARVRCFRFSFFKAYRGHTGRHSASDRPINRRSEMGIHHRCVPYSWALSREKGKALFSSSHQGHTSGKPDEPVFLPSIDGSGTVYFHNGENLQVSRCISCTTLASLPPAHAPHTSTPNTTTAPSCFS
jgi:hypothetical protein